jgi:hypothetical protein
MDAKARYERPDFDTALSAWKSLLAGRKLPDNCLWIFEENLCFEKAPEAPGGFRLGFQTRFTPPPAEAERLAYDYFAEMEPWLVFYRVGTNAGRSICLLLCDEWFNPKGEAEGFIRRDEWGISFRPGLAETIEEITDEARWKNRLLRNRPLHDLDFSMTLRAVHEALAHGRVLTSYEHYALRLLHLWRRVFGSAE